MNNSNIKYTCYIIYNYSNSAANRNLIWGGGSYINIIKIFMYMLFLYSEESLNPLSPMSTALYSNIDRQAFPTENRFKHAMTFH